MFAEVEPRWSYCVIPVQKAVYPLHEESKQQMA